MKEDIEEFIGACRECKTHRRSKTTQEPVIPLDIYSYQPGDYWLSDLFQVKEVNKKLPKNYLIIADIKLCV